jgi:hypothetical protein
MVASVVGDDHPLMFGQSAAALRLDNSMKTWFVRTAGSRIGHESMPEDRDFRRTSS